MNRGAVADSSRGSKQSGDLRYIKESTAPRRGARDRRMTPLLLTPFQGAGHFPIPSGSLRFASTTGYYRAAFQATRTGE